jgi:hypothetical protein
VRAIVSLSKGTEILFPYQPSLEDRAERRKSLERYGFVCNCEICGLPNDLSDALDEKIKLVKDAVLYWNRLYKGQEIDVIRAVQLVEIFMSITIRERLFFNYALFVHPLNLLRAFGKPALLEEVCKALRQLYQRHLGNGVHRGAGVKTVSLYLEESLRHVDGHQTNEAYLAFVRGHRLDTRLEAMARSVISYIQNIP